MPFHSVRNKCCHLGVLVIESSAVIFCMSETCLYDDDSVLLSVLTPEFHILHHAPHPVKKVVELAASLKNHYNLKKQHIKSFKSS